MVLRVLLFTAEATSDDAVNVEAKRIFQAVLDGGKFGGAQGGRDCMEYIKKSLESEQYSEENKNLMFPIFETLDHVSNIGFFAVDVFRGFDLVYLGAWSRSEFKEALETEEDGGIIKLRLESHRYIVGIRGSEAPKLSQQEAVHTSMMAKPSDQPQSLETAGGASFQSIKHLRSHAPATAQLFISEVERFWPRVDSSGAYISQKSMKQVIGQTVAGHSYEEIKDLMPKWISAIFLRLFISPHNIDEGGDFIISMKGLKFLMSRFSANRNFNGKGKASEGFGLKEKESQERFKETFSDIQALHVFITEAEQLRSSYLSDGKLPPAPKLPMRKRKNSFNASRDKKKRESFKRKINKVVSDFFVVSATEFLFIGTFKKEFDEALNDHEGDVWMGPIIKKENVLDVSCVEGFSYSPDERILNSISNLIDCSSLWTMPALAKVRVLFTAWKKEVEEREQEKREFEEGINEECVREELEGEMDMEEEGNSAF